MSRETAASSEKTASTVNADRSSGTRLAILAGMVLVVVGVAMVVGFLGLDSGPEPGGAAAVPVPKRYDADRAMGYLIRLCELGPRPTGSPAMKQQQDLLTRHCKELGAQVRLQESQIRHPVTGKPVPMANLIASWHPGREKRFLICAHYDTRPFPDRDRRDPRGTFVGANDGASGVAAVMELAHQLDDLPDHVGVDLVLFDAEEFVFDEGRDDYFLGSIYFAQQYKMNAPAVPYQAGILLDMVGDRELKLYFERNSLRYASDVARSLWKVADRLRVDAFVARVRHEVRDDHLPLNQIAGIPTVDVIDFDYPRPGLGAPQYWHTEQDVPANCSGESLAAVVWVVHEWLKIQ